ncbi:acid-sensing ion channel 2 isoform X2 [Brachionus plicatilis]|uniref:Acid-sensing ion channel 2 isoform X2 n=1 Tax=Brachionus plicatilis TaxID=10195 RepID=A0A3M7PRN0_BRAPC|nr:acid-sensing ion channel 2 isoform X2 [Brachionus plicatilis]
MAIKQFMANEVVTVQKIIYESPSEFPAVGICNLNSFEGIHVNNLFDENGNFYENLTNITNFEAHLASWQNETLNWQNKVEIGENKFFPLELIPKIVIKTSLKYCRFEGKPCDHNDFSYYFNQVYGNCFTFNLGKKQPVKKVQTSGIDDGLKIELSVSSYWSDKELIFKDGIRIVIHNQTLGSFPEDEGMNAQYDLQNNIAISRKYLKRLPEPHSDCVIKPGLDSFIKEFTFEKYSQKFCLKCCLQIYLTEKCFCFDKKLPKPNRNVSRCKNNFHFECIQKERDQFYFANKSSECLNKCPSECEKIIYFKQMYTAPIASEKFLINPLNDLIVSGPFMLFKNVHINVFFNEMEYEVINEYPSMTFEALVSNVGGIFGLFIGISLLSIAELFEIF